MVVAPKKKTCPHCRPNKVEVDDDDDDNDDDETKSGKRIQAENVSREMQQQTVQEATNNDQVEKAYVVQLA